MNAEYVFSTPSGVMSIDFHPEHASLLVAGLYDGSVVAYDIYSKSNQPIFKSTVRNGKHTDPVWQVCWQEDGMNRTLSFFSVSSDGRVTLWTMNKSEMSYQNLIELRANDSDKVRPTLYSLFFFFKKNHVCVYYDDLLSFIARLASGSKQKGFRSSRRQWWRRRR